MNVSFLGRGALARPYVLSALLSTAFASISLLGFFLASAFSQLRRRGRVPPLPAGHPRTSRLCGYRCRNS